MYDRMVILGQWAYGSKTKMTEMRRAIGASVGNMEGGGP